MDSSQHYTVLARRFRPQAFDDVVGQEHVAQALRNAIRTDRVAHAYLFTGARGVGKTSTARIFAKALNCPNVVDGVPCNACDVCDAISAGNDVDVLEIDGASNRGIDDIRQLRANVSVKSMRSRCKVYIIDEVHMLTKEAFNALLKTLEEPPPNVKFVFCTTEPNKVPDTILSRCQRFDFSTIDTTRIADRLTEIAAAEGRSVEPAAVELVARRAAGSMRDSQSLFDQLLAFGGETITADDVHRLLGTADDDRLVGMARALHSRQPAVALAELDAALGEGVQLGEMLGQALSLFRDLMIVAAGADEVPLLAVSSGHRVELKELADAWGLPTILAGMQILSEAKSRSERVNYARALVELALVRVATLEDLSLVSGLVEAVKSGKPLAIASTPAPPQPNSTPAAASTPPAGRVESPQTTSQERVAENHGQAHDRDDPTPAVEEPQRPAVPRFNLEPGNEKSIIAELKKHVEDATAMHLEKLCGHAILGPNRMELVFPTSYHFGKTYCEQPAVINRIAEVLAEITGKPITVVFSLAEVDAGPKPTTEDRSSRRSGEKLPEKASDQFAARVQDLFSATIVRVEENRSAVGDGVDDGATESSGDAEQE